MKEGISLKKVKVIEKKNIKGDFWWVVLESEDGFKFVAGQYVSVRVSEKGERRDYSMAGKEGENGFALLVDVGPGGVGSKFFENLKEGEMVEVLGPMGEFKVRDEDEGAVMIATGSGIAPIKMMVEEEVKKGKKTWLVWGMRYEKDVFWVEMFEEWEKRYSNFKFDLVLSKGGEEWKGKRGHVQDVVERELGEWKDSGFYICGARETVEDIEEWLLSNEVKLELVRKENF